MLNIGPQELLLILVIALIVVGPQRLPTLGRSIGRGLREIRKAQDEVKRTIQVNLDEEPVGDPKRGPAAPKKGGTGSVGSASGEGVTADAADDAAAAAAAGTRAVPPAVAHDPTPLASEPPSPSEMTEISRSLGRSLGELRRAKEEIRKSFRVDVGEPTPSAGPSRTSPTPATPATPADPSDEAPAG
jgi:sec-independent protein translocase protein TatA